MRQYISYVVSKTAKVMLIAIASLTLLCNSTSAQQIAANAKIDSMLIFIGGQVDFTIEVTQNKGQTVNFPILVDTLSKTIEIVEFSKIDTTELDNNRIELKQVLRITSFDSGLHLIPAIEFELIDAKGNQIARTSPIALKVVNPFNDVNPEKGIIDIKQPIDTPFSFEEIFAHLWIALVAYAIRVILIILLVLFILKKSPLKLFVKEKPVIPPHILALNKLEKIKGEKLWQKSMVKEYYIELSDTVREYIENRYKLPALEQTTDETLDNLKGNKNINSDILNKIQQILSTADLVKFAKMEPPQNENDLSLNNAFDFINATIPVPIVLKDSSNEKVSTESKVQTNDSI